MGADVGAPDGLSSRRFDAHGTEPANDIDRHGTPATNARQVDRFVPAAAMAKRPYGVLLRKQAGVNPLTAGHQSPWGQSKARFMPRVLKARR